MWTAQECAKLEPPALPLIPVAVLRPRILIAMHEDEGTLIGLRVQGFYKAGAGVVGIEAGGKKGGEACIAFCYTSGRRDLFYSILYHGAAKKAADAR